MGDVDAHSDAIWDLIDEGAKLEEVATGFTFTEGPSFGDARTSADYVVPREYRLYLGVRF